MDKGDAGPDICGIHVEGDGYPQLAREDIHAALAYASLLAREDIALASG